MRERTTDKHWQRYGREDPYFGVVSDTRFHREQLTPDALRDFFRTGEEHAAYILEQIRRHMVPDFAPRRVLDFGCGVGRCTLPFGRHADAVLGVDVSGDMIEEGRRNAETMGAKNVAFDVSDAALSNVEGPFDLVHSFIVFQHIRPRRGEQLIRRLIELLSEDGVAVVHVLYRVQLSPVGQAARWLRKHVPPVHWAANLRYGKPLRYPLMEKNVYPLNRLFYLLQQAGCGQGMFRLEGRRTMRGLLLFFRRQPDEIPYNAG